MRFTSKEGLIESIDTEHQAFVEIVRSIPAGRYLDKGVWGDEWNIRDLLAHLTEWEQMFLTWFREGAADGQPEMPAKGYKWNQTPALNRAIWERYRQKPVVEVLADFETSYQEIFSLAQELSPKELLTPGHFTWTGKNPLTTYLGANTTSHYRTATKILKRWLRDHPDVRQTLLEK